MTDKEYQKRLCFKFSIKQGWNNTVWFSCSRFSMPYDLDSLIDSLVTKMAYDTLIFKIECREKVIKDE